MHFKWSKLLLRLLGFELLSKEVSNWVMRLQAKLRQWMLKMSVWFGIFLLLKLAFIFGLVALALYLNELYYSNYIGFVLVAGGCLGLMLLLLIIMKLVWSKEHP